jgi:hypothetical protein
VLRAGIKGGNGGKVRISRVEGETEVEGNELYDCEGEVVGVDNDGEDEYDGLKFRGNLQGEVRVKARDEPKAMVEIPRGGLQNDTLPVRLRAGADKINKYQAAISEDRGEGLVLCEWVNPCSELNW